MVWASPTEEKTVKIHCSNSRSCSSWLLIDLGVVFMHSDQKSA